MQPTSFFVQIHKAMLDYSKFMKNELRALLGIETDVQNIAAIEAAIKAKEAKAASKDGLKNPKVITRVGRLIDVERTEGGSFRFTILSPTKGMIKTIRSAAQMFNGRDYPAEAIVEYSEELCVSGVTEYMDGTTVKTHSKSGVADGVEFSVYGTPKVLKVSEVIYKEMSKAEKTADKKRAEK